MAVNCSGLIPINKITNKFSELSWWFARGTDLNHGSPVSPYGSFNLQPFLRDMIEEQEKRPKEEGRKKGRFQNCNFHPKKKEREKELKLKKL